MKYFLFLLIFLPFSAAISAQERVIDSIKMLLEKSPADTTTVRLFQELAETYRVSPESKNRDSAISYGNKSLILARNANDKKGEVRALVVLGKSSRYELNPVKAIEYFQEGLALSENIKDTPGIIMGLTGYALLYYYKSDFRQELSYYLRIENLARQIHDGNSLRNSFGLIGKTYMLLNLLDSAEYYLREAMALNKNDDEDPFPIITLGSVKMQQGNYTVALNYFKTALAIYERKNDKFRIAQGYYNIANLYERQEKLDSALYNYNKSYNSGSQIADSLYTIAGVGLDIALIYEKQNNLREALRYYKIASSAKERMKSEENLTKLLNLEFQAKERTREIEAAKIAYANRIKLLGLLAGLGIFLIISFFLLRNNLNKKRINIVLAKQKEEIENAYVDLKSAQAQLIQSEKMASLGELTAGIAHEIQNPLNFVNNFSELNTELIADMKAELLAGNNDDAILISNDIAENEQKINSHGKRADGIVKSMLQHSQSSHGVKELTNINDLSEEYLRLSYHGMRAKDISLRVTINTDFDATIEEINIIPQDIGRVLLNLYNNGLYSVAEKKKQQNENYEPVVSVSTKKLNGKVEIRVKDNGLGISQKIVDKIFQPFFTTKPTGQGTGLGLSLSYDTVQAHGGKIKVESREGEGAEFIIELPVN